MEKLPKTNKSMKRSQAFSLYGCNLLYLPPNDTTEFGQMSIRMVGAGGSASWSGHLVHLVSVMSSEIKDVRIQWPGHSNFSRVISKQFYKHM